MMAVRRQHLLYLAAIGVEGCWLYAIVDLANRHTVGSSLSVAGVLALFPVAVVFNSLLKRLKWPAICVALLSWLGWAVGMLLVVRVLVFGDVPLADRAWLISVLQSLADVIYVFKPELLVLLSSIVLWWMGRRLASRPVDFAAMVGEFQFGLIMLVLTFLFASLWQTSLDGPVALASTFFVFGLLGISLAHASERDGWLWGLQRRHWSSLLAISVAVVFILGLAITAIVTPGVLQYLLDLLLAALGRVWGLVLKVLDFLSRFIPDPGAQGQLPTSAPLPGEVPAEDQQLFNLPEILKRILTIGWTVLVVGFVLFALWRISSDVLRWLRRKLAGLSGVEYDPLEGALKADFLSLLKGLVKALLGLWPLLWSRRKKKPLQPETASVRQVYRQLLRWAASAGHPRHMCQTPYEFCRELSGVLPETREDLGLITEQYARARYGTQSSTTGELEEVRRAWQRVRQAPRQSSSRSDVKKGEFK